MMAGTLRATGLEAQILSQKDHANVVELGGLAIVKVLVPAYQYERACRVLEDAGIRRHEETP
jgi:hypothetical protein